MYQYRDIESLYLLVNWSNQIGYGYDSDTLNSANNQLNHMNEFKQVGVITSDAKIQSRNWRVIFSLFFYCIRTFHESVNVALELHWNNT